MLPAIILPRGLFMFSNAARGERGGALIVCGAPAGGKAVSIWAVWDKQTEPRETGAARHA